MKEETNCDIRGRLLYLSNRILIVFMALLVSFTASCSRAPLHRSDSPGTLDVSVDSQAVLDWDLATVILPLDRYGMNPDEVQIVEAAGSIEMARCQEKTDEVPQSVIDEAARYLKTVPVVTHWLWGRWDVPYIARYGWIGREPDPPLHVGVNGYDQTDPCWQHVVESDLIPIASDIANESTDGAVLTRINVELDDRVLVDSSYLSLQAKWNACIAAGGYIIEKDTPIAGVHVENTWTEEQINKAFMTEAQCADDMSYTQQVADIAAGYQMEYILANESELVTIRQHADKAVSNAEQILSSLGIL